MTKKPSSLDEISTSHNEKLPKNVETKEDPTEELLSETVSMDTSIEANVVTQPSVPVIRTGNISSKSENERRHGIPTLNSSPKLPPEKVKENKNIEDEDEAVVQLVFCAYNLNEAIQLAEQNFPLAEFKVL